MNIDTMYEHLISAHGNNYQSEQHKNLLDRILFSGERVPQNDYDHAMMVYRVANTRVQKGDYDNARLFLYYTARAMGLVK